MPLKLVRHLRRSPCWYIRGTVRGIRVFESSGTDDRQAADALRIKRESDLLDRSIFGPGATVTFLEAAVSYLEAGGERRMVQPLVDHFKTAQLAKINQDAVDTAAKTLFPTAGPATRKRHVYGPITAILRHAGKKGWIIAPRLEHPKVPEPVTRWSTPERLVKLLPHCSPVWSCS